MKTDHALYADLPGDVKSRIRQAQICAAHAANAELVRLYWDIGRLIDQRQAQEGWSAGVIPRLARDLKNELPELKGFSERNLGRMVAFFRAYPEPQEFLPQPVAKESVRKGNCRSLWRKLVVGQFEVIHSIIKLLA